jgi:phosphatidylserine/phosphatidylglycerophosphate/cardiolipin synthase-like enzyme
MAEEFQVSGQNAAARFTLKLHRGQGMVLLAMNWRHGKPPRNFVGFTIACHEPGETEFLPLSNRLRFARPETDEIDAHPAPSDQAPFQKFRWVHVPRKTEPAGELVYRVTPAFMDFAGPQDLLGTLSFGEAQTAAITLAGEPHQRLLEVAFSRGLGFEARQAVLQVLDAALADAGALVQVVAYELDEPAIVTRLEQLGPRLRIIIDDAAAHGDGGSAETQAAARLAISAGPANVKRQNMGHRQHNTTITVSGPNTKAVVCGSTSFSGRGLSLQASSALVLRTESAVQVFSAAFEAYWTHETVAAFGATAAATWTDLRIPGMGAQVTFSPHLASNGALQAIAGDLDRPSTKSLLYSLAFVHQTSGLLRDAIRHLSQEGGVFVYGISDRNAGGLDVQRPDGDVSAIFPHELTPDTPAPLKPEPADDGTALHHKFLVVDFDKPSARVYLGSHDFSAAADEKNGEHLLLIRDQRVATSYMVEALRLFDHCHFRLAQKEAAEGKRKLQLARPPRTNAEQPWFAGYYTDPHKIRDRKLFG